MLTDFGLARAADDATLTRTGVIAGTPQYMSPEQARGDSVDHRTDLFSLGSVLYAMSTGRSPFRAETSYGILRRITDTHARPIRELNPHIPEWLTRIVARLHAKDPAERYSSAEEISRLLEQCLAHVQQPTAVALPESLQEPRDAYSEWDTLRRAMRIVAAVAGLVVIALAAAWGTWVLTQGTPSERAASNPTAAASSQTTPATEAASSEVDSSAAAWSDGAAEEIYDLEIESAELEQRSSRLWDGSNITSQ
jgi:serine/threonine protein kinase